MSFDIHIIGGGLAGSEAAWQLAEAGLRVRLSEMRGGGETTPAHETDCLAEMVCSNSFRSDDADHNAVGLLHQEMRALGSLIIRTADRHRVPAGSALAVDRQRRTCGDAMPVCCSNDQRAKGTHFLVEQANGIVIGIIGSETVGADHLRKAIRLVRRRGLAAAAHLAEPHSKACLGE